MPTPDPQDRLHQGGVPPETHPDQEGANDATTGDEGGGPSVGYGGAADADRQGDARGSSRDGLVP